MTVRKAGVGMGLARWVNAYRGAPDWKEHRESYGRLGMKASLA